MSNSLLSRPSTQQASEAAKELLRRKAARSNLMEFTKFTFHDYQVHWHHQLIAEKLEEAMDSAMRRKRYCLLINTPPQVGKSQLVSRHFPAYVLGRNPELKILGGSHSSSLAEAMNHDVKNIIDDDEYRKLFPETRLAERGGKGKRTADYFEVEGHQGFLRSAGAGVKIAGYPAQLALLDDPLGSQADSDSPAIRERVWNWIISDVMNRLPKWAPIVLCQTRWSLDDPAGRFIVNMANGTGLRWEIVCIPSLFTGTKTHPRDPRTKVDQALWPTHQDTASLKRLRELNPRSFQALHQQDPIGAGSEWPPEWFTDDVFFDEWPDDVGTDKVMALDSSKGVGGRLGDYSAFVMMARHDGIFYIEADMANDRNTLDMRYQAVELAKRFKPTLFGFEESFGGEAFCESVREACQKEGLKLVLATVNNLRPSERGEPSNTPKEQRIRFLTEFLGARKFRFKRSSSSTRLLVQQLQEFPNGLHDDGPDATEMALQLFKGW